MGVNGVPGWVVKSMTGLLDTAAATPVPVLWVIEELFDSIAVALLEVVVAGSSTSDTGGSACEDVEIRF